MSQVVMQLVRRLATPAVASGLVKEELCLALAAVAQLKPLSPEISASPSTLVMEPLARRSLRVIPHCTSQELRMIAQGAGALQWSNTSALSTFVVNALVQRLYKHIENRGGVAASSSTEFLTVPLSKRVRLQDLLAVVAQAMGAGLFFNVTLHALITQSAVSLAGEGSSLSAAAAEELIAVACAFLGEKEGVMLVQRVRAVLAAASTQGAVSSGMEVLNRCVAGQPLPLSPAWSTSYTQWSQQRSALLSSFQPSAANDAVDPATTQKQKAQHDVLQVVQRLRNSTNVEDAELSEVLDEELLRVLEEVKVFQIYDPVTLLTLDGAVLNRLTALEKARSTPAAAAAAAYENIVYAQAQRYPRTLAALRERDADTAETMTSATSSAASPSASSKALQRLPTIQTIYQKALSGATVSDKDLFLVSNNINTYSADEVAEAVFVFAHARDIPSNLIVILASTVEMLTLDGVVALLRATRHDRTGALRTVVEACLRNNTHLQQCTTVASVESLVELVRVLSLPPTRWNTAPTETSALEAQLRELALTQLHLQVEAMPWASLLCVVRGIGNLPGGEDTINAACDCLTAHLGASHPSNNISSFSPSLDLSHYLELVEALQYGDVVNERLLDLLAVGLTAHFNGLATPLSLSIAAADTRHAAFLRFVSLELSYGSPELAEVVAGVVYNVAHADDWTALSMELLLSAALFAFDRCNVSSFSSAAFALPHLVLQHIAQSRRLSELVTAELATAVVDVVSRLPIADADNAAVAYCVRALLPISATSLSPLTSARLISVACHKASRVVLAHEIPPELYGLVTENVRGLPPDIFTSLCLSVSKPSFDDALANRLIDVLPHMADQLTSHQLSRCVFGLGEMHRAGQRLSHQVMTEALSDYVVDNVELFTSGRDIAALLHGFAKLQCTKRNLYSVFAKQLSKRYVRYTLDFQSISFLLFAFSSVKFVDQHLVNSFCQTFVQHAEELAAPDLLMTLRGVSRMCLLNTRLYWRLGDEAVKHADEFPLQAQCELLHAYGALEQRHPTLATTLARRIAANVAALPSVSAAVDVLVSLWLMEYKVAIREDTIAIADHVVQHGSELSCTDIMKLCSIIRDVHWAHRPLLNAIAARSIELKMHDRLEAGVARTVLDTLGSQHVFHLQARTELSQLARSVSKEVVQLSGEEQEELNLLTSH